MERTDKPLHVYLHSRARHHHPVKHGAAGQTQQGSTTHFVVSYDDSLGANGPTLANAVLANCERDYATLQGWFGGITPGDLPFQILIQPGENGASHASCLATGLNCDAFNGDDGDLLCSLVVAEEDEVFMANQNAGWDCGGSNGEALSRILASEIYPAELTPPGLGITFATGAAWLNGNRPDWVSRTEPTDQDPVSTGCGTLFINYLRYQLNYSLTQIVEAAGATLADTYKTLTGKTDAFAPFAALLAKKFPEGSQANLDGDNPWPI